MRHPPDVGGGRGVGLTQRQIARRIGVSESLVSRWATGRRPAAPRHLDTLRGLLQARIERIDGRSRP